MASRRTRLKELAAEYALSPRRLAELTHVSIPTATAWLRPVDNAAAREIPEPALELLAMKLDAWGSVQIDPDLFAAFEILSERTGESVTELINQRLRKALMSECKAIEEIRDALGTKKPE